jgi:hypothetical protein
MKEALNNVRALKKWYDGLDEDTQAKTAIYCVVGNIEEHANVDLIQGDMKSLVLSLANSMVHSRDFYDMAKEAMALVDTYCENTIQEEREKLGIGKEKYVS